MLPENFDVIERHADKFLRVARKKLDGEISVEFHAEVIGATPDDLRNVILYSLKQHLFAGEFEKSRKFWIAAGDPIKGSRLSYSKAARAIIAEGKAIMLPSAADNAPQVSAAAPVAIAAPVIEASPSPPISAPVQIAMSFDVPPVPLLQLVEATRIERGLSQREVAAQFGMKQPGYSNAVVRRHDKLGAWARNRALEWLKAA